MSDWKYKGTAVITGAGSGIGRALAENLAAKGMDLALADINEERLEEVRGALASNQIRVTTHKVDVGDRDAVKNFADEVRKEHDTISLVFNNAGVALGGRFEDVTEDDFDWLMDINFRAVVDLTREMLPEVKKAGIGQIVNVSSLFGLVAPPGQAAYCASKFAVRGFSEALRHELDGSDVGVTVVHPGGVATNVANDARVGAAIQAEAKAQNLSDAEVEKLVSERKKDMNKLLKLEPKKAAEIIVDAVEKKKGRVLVGSDAKAVEILQRLMPGTYFKVLKRRIQGADAQR